MKPLCLRLGSKAYLRLEKHAVLQGLNLSLKYIAPLALTLSTASEPIIGSVLGVWTAKIMQMPLTCTAAVAGKRLTRCEWAAQGTSSG
jgi:hypothetical protein